MMKNTFVAMLAVVGAMEMQAAPAKPLFVETFEKAALEKVPEGMLVLDGEFAVKAEGGNKFLELPGAPLETFGVLFGPSQAADVTVAARIHGTGKGRRFPVFGVGLNGVGGYRLQVAPAKKMLDLYKGEDLKVSVPLAWESGKWTHLRLSIRSLNSGGLAVVGKAWQEGAPEPAAWAIQHTEAEASPAGRASIWGNPFSGTPIRFDDLSLTPADKMGK
ncbi:MAG: hypothetical protein EXS29_03255 [Pedosphaera sp.]|nr:hypothetical protein [Pedosphaera sp.]